MSASINQGPREAGEGAEDDVRAVLAGWLDDYVVGRCERADLEDAFLSICRSNQEAAWDALALVDQYQRLGRIDAELARALKAPISELGLGVRGSARAATTHSPAGREADSNASGMALGPNAIPLRPAADLEEDEEEPDVEDEPLPPAAAPKRSPVSTHVEPATRVRAPAFAAPSERRGSAEMARGPGILRSPATRQEVLRGRYELLSVLGRDSAGIVYKALDKHRANLTDGAQFVAIKILHGNFATDARALAELERGFHRAQSLSHPNIATVFDLDRDADTFFVVMELLQGELLSDVLRRLNSEPMARKHAFAILSRVGSALAYAHQRDSVHGNLKPASLLITASGEVRVLDFGFAQLNASDAGFEAEDAVSTGSAAYASSERVHGMEPDPSDDVYSFACIAYELLSGRHPYGGRSGLLARAHGRKPQRIPGLNGKQWHALQRALVWDRSERRIGIVDLMSGLECEGYKEPPVPPEFLVPDRRRHPSKGIRRFVLLLLLAAVAAAAYLIMRLPVPEQATEPEVVMPQPPATDAERLSTETSVPVEGTSSAQSSSVPSAAPETAAPTAEPSAGPSGDSSPASAQNAGEEHTAPVIAEESSTLPAVGQSVLASGARIEFDKDTYVATESDARVTLSIKRSGAMGGIVAFRWVLRGNSAAPGEDFAAIGPGEEQIPSGARSATITIPLVSDSLIENTELFLVELEPLGPGIELGELSHAAVIVVDDD